VFCNSFRVRHLLPCLRNIGLSKPNEYIYREYHFDNDVYYFQPLLHLQGKHVWAEAEVEGHHCAVIDAEAAGQEIKAPAIGAVVRNNTPVLPDPALIPRIVDIILRIQLHQLS